MNILFIIDRIELKYFEFNQLVTNFWLIKTFLDNGNSVQIATIDDLSVIKSVAKVNSRKSYLKNENIFFEKEQNLFNIEDFELVMFRPDPPVDLDYINATYVFDFVDESKVCLINSPKAIRNFNEKFHAMKFTQYMPENFVTSNKEMIKEFLKEQDEIVLKPLSQCFGSGVMFLKYGDLNTNTIIKQLTNDGKTLIMVQKYIPEIKHGDIRVLTLGDKIMDECVYKVPTSDDFKFNTHNDNYIKKAILTNEERKQFEYVAKELNKMGIYMAGLDIVKSQILEINVTSPCYFIKEINNAFSVNIQNKIYEYIKQKVNNKVTVSV